MAEHKEYTENLTPCSCYFRRQERSSQRLREILEQTCALSFPQIPQISTPFTHTNLSNQGSLPQTHNSPQRVSV